MNVLPELLVLTRIEIILDRRGQVGIVLGHFGKIPFFTHHQIVKIVAFLDLGGGHEIAAFVFEIERVNVVIRSRGDRFRIGEEYHVVDNFVIIPTARMLDARQLDRSERFVAALAAGEFEVGIIVYLAVIGDALHGIAVTARFGVIHVIVHAVRLGVAGNERCAAFVVRDLQIARRARCAVLYVAPLAVVDDVGAEDRAVFYIKVMVFDVVRAILVDIEDRLGIGFRGIALARNHFEMPVGCARFVNAVAENGVPLSA